MRRFNPTAPRAGSRPLQRPQTGGHATLGPAGGRQPVQGPQPAARMTFGDYQQAGLGSYDPTNRASIAGNRAALEAKAMAAGHQWTPPWARGVMTANTGMAPSTGPSTVGGAYGQASGGGLPGTTPGGGGPGGGGATAGTTAGLPLDPLFEAQRRALEDALAAQLQPLGPAREQILAQEALAKARLGTNQGIDQNNLLEQMAARGIFNSGIQTRDTGRLATDYLRQYQDLATATAGSLGGVAQQQAGAQAEYQRGLMELLLNLANRTSQDQYAPVPEQSGAWGYSPSPATPALTPGAGGGRRTSGGGKKKKAKAKGRRR